MVAILPILVSDCVMLAPILSWSVTIRKYDLKIVVALWGLLMFAALIPVAIKNLPGVLPEYVLTQLATCDGSKDPTFCNYTNAVSDINWLSESFYKK